MEDVARSYEGQVRFLYMYIREAHPDPERAPCGPTEELGWRHPSFNTVSQEHRAQRARWLKQDFDLNFPWIIDFMDGRIRSGYGGSGFYSGFVIDCDGTVLVTERWGWATPETQWCGLNLPPVTQLTDLLDQYLADPPACYRGVTREPEVWVVPTAAHLNGSNGTTWRTDLTIANPGVEQAVVDITLQPKSPHSEEGQTRVFEIPAGATLTLGDVIMSEFGFTGAAALRLQSLEALVVVSRTFNQTTNGTYGQWIAGIPSHQAISEVGVGHLPLLEESQRYRTNLGLTSLSDEAISVAIEFTGLDGQALGDLAVDLEPFDHVQLNRVLAELSFDLPIEARATVSILTRGGRAVAYTSVVDNVTGDPTFAPAIANSWVVDMNLPAVSNTAGVHDSRWSSDVVVVNASNQETEIELALHHADGRQLDALIELGSGQSALIRDVVASQFGVEGNGSMTLQSNPGLLAVSRTFNHDSEGTSGTFGQFISRLDMSSDSLLEVGDTAHLLELAQNSSDGFRTNLGLVALSGFEATVQIDFYDRQGVPLDSLERRIAGYEWLQLNAVLDEVLGLTDVEGIRAVVRVTGDSGPVSVHASIVDNLTGDPVFQPAIKIGAP